MSTPPIQPSPLAAAVIALLQGTAVDARPIAAPPNRVPATQAAPATGSAKVSAGAGAGGMRPLPRGSLLNIVA
jgi:hypothetical protein